VTNTDRAWEDIGRSDPYYGVLTKAQFEYDQFDERSRAAFFESGEEYVELVLELARTRLDESFSPRRVLDFGCGVGRISLPFASRAEAVVGVDISPGMLIEARSNADAAGRDNVTLVLSDDRLSLATGAFNLVHAFIVMQHIAPARGLRILARMIDVLETGGLGMIHFTYSNSSQTPLARRLLTTAYERLPMMYTARNAAKRQPLNSPQMHMHRYDLNAIFRTLQEAECHDVHVRFTEASHYSHPIYGVLIMFKKDRLDTGRHS
jgi:SAM-dependent methyltransferase